MRKANLPATVWASNKYGTDFATISHRHVLPATLVLIGLGYLDMAYTLVAVHLGWAHEANPLLATVLHRSDGAFVLVKLASLMIPIAILECLRGRHPQLIERALRFGAYGYAAWYGIASLAVHVIRL